VISGEKIATLIRYPHEIDENDLVDLNKLVEQYPYCSSLHVIYLKGLALHHDLNFERELAKTAIHATDRNHLYALIHSNPIQLGLETEQIEANIQHLQPEPRETVQEITEVIEILPPTEEVVEEKTEVSFIAVEEISHTEIENKINTTDLDDDILTNAIDLVYVDSGIEPLKEEKKLDLKQEYANELAIETKTTSIEKSSDAVDKNDSLGPLSFVDWLKQKQNKIVEIEKLDEINEDEEKEGDRKKVAVNELLEKFINEQPTISRPVKDFYSPLKNARESIEESDDMVTETLAKIYALQKNYSKAITAYEKLILLYPEKKTFFASRIENLREEQKKR